MQKELNPELFGTPVAGASRRADKTPDSETNPAIILGFEKKLVEMKKQIDELSEQMANMAAHVNQFLKLSEGRFAKMQQQILQFDQANSQRNLETNTKITLFHQKVTDSRSLDRKAQEMVDRHNGVLRTYEVRMNQMQQLLAAKDRQVLEMQSIINESKSELARLKRL